MCQLIQTQASGYCKIIEQLPIPRIILTRAFCDSEVDYTGSFEMEPKTGRGSKTIKAQRVYIAKFVCMSTKSVHLEAVSDLSTSAILTTLTGIISRRGNHILSHT